MVHVTLHGFMGQRKYTIPTEIRRIYFDLINLSSLLVEIFPWTHTESQSIVTIVMQKYLLFNTPEGVMYTLPVFLCPEVGGTFLKNNILPQE